MKHRTGSAVHRVSPPRPQAGGLEVLAAALVLLLLVAGLL